MDTTSRILLLLDVVELGSFAKAAANRNVDRSMVSKQIVRLEEELGVRLINRTTRSFSLTAAGSEIVKKGKDLRILLNETVSSAQNFHQEPRGELKITASSIIGKRYIMPVINDFQKRFPQVEVELRLDDRIVDLVTEGFDLAFRIGEPRDSTLIARQVARNRLLVIASPEFVATFGEPKTIEELMDLPAATYAGSGVRVEGINYINDAGDPIEAKIRSVFRSNDPDSLMLKVLSGSAYFVAPAFLVDQEIINNQLVPLLTDVKLQNYGAMYAVYPHRDLPVRTRLFLDAVREYIGKDKPIWEQNIPGFEDMYQG